MAKHLFIIFLFFSFMSFTINHDVPVSTFKLKEEKSEVILDIQMDQHDFLTSSGQAKATLVSVTSYLNKHSSWSFDGKESEIVLKSVEVIKGHIVVKGGFNQVVTGFTNLKVRNSCLIDIPHQTNNIFINTSNIQKDYRMYKGRTFIEVTE